jgi:hypothetical protein
MKLGDEVVVIATENGRPLSKSARKKLLKKEATEEKKSARAIARVSRKHVMRDILYLATLFA